MDLRGRCERLADRPLESFTAGTAARYFTGRRAEARGECRRALAQISCCAREPCGAGEEEVHAKHILVDNEADAKKVIAELNGGADFAALSKQYSKDPSAAEQGGDLGFFKKDEMVPEFATAAFALQPGQITQTPVHSQFGWHVILLVERRPAAPPTFDKAREELRQKMIQEGVQKAVAKARSTVAVEKFNMDGSPVRATDQAEPPPAK